MVSNFDFLKTVDKSLYSIAQDGEKLFRDEYFNQSVVQFRIFAEKMAKKIYDSESDELTFDTILNNLKDRIKSQREKEFIEDLFYIKKEGNKCAHGEEATAISTLEVIRRSFEAAINYVWAKHKDKNTDKLIFDETLLITQQPKNEEKMIDKYLKLAQSSDSEISKEQLLNQKQGEFLSSVDKSKDENNIKDKNKVSNINDYKKSKTGLSQKKLKIKEKIRQAKNNLKGNINKEEPKKNSQKKVLNKKSARKTSKNNKKDNKEFFKALIFILFVVFSVCILLFMMI